MSPAVTIVAHVFAWTLFFLAVHAVTAFFLRADARTDLRVSRGIAALLLVLVGLATLALRFPLWRVGFLIREEVGSPGFAVAAFFAGHFVGDLVWLAVLWVTRGLPPRRDLVVHHGIGLLAVAAACWFQAGFTLIAVVMTSEVMPAGTGVGAWGKARGRPELERLAVVIGYRALLFWRIPLWSALFLVMARSAFGLETHVGEDLRTASAVATVGLVAILALDAYWVDEYRRLLRKTSLRRGVGIRLRALRPW